MGGPETGSPARERKICRETCSLDYLGRNQRSEGLTRRSGGLASRTSS